MQAISRRATAISLETQKEESILITILVMLLFVLPINMMGLLRPVIYSGILGIELLFILVDSRNGKADRRKIDLPLVALSASYFAYLLLCWVMNGGDGAERILQAAIFLLTLISFSRYGWAEQRLAVLRRVIAALMVLSLVYWALSGRVTNYYAAFYGHGNAFAVVVVCAIAIILLSCGGYPSLQTYLLLALCGMLLMFANSRSAIVTTLILISLTALLAWLDRRGLSCSKVATVLFIAAIVAAGAFSILYPSLVGTPLGAELEQLSREVLNKNFFSGREVVWKMVLDATRGHELFGLGLGMVPSLIYETSFSSHNLYLQTIMQSGIVGMGLLISILWLVVRRLNRLRGWPACVGVSLVVAILFHETLEVSLTQNNFDVGIMFWMLLGICLSSARVISTSKSVSS